MVASYILRRTNDDDAVRIGLATRIAGSVLDQAADFLPGSFYRML